MQLFPPGTTKLQGVDLNMKTMKKMSLMVLALLLALSLGAAAFAEETEAAATEAVPAATEAAPAEAEAAPAATDTAAADTKSEADALSNALAAYAKAKAEARKQARLDSLKEELNGYVTSGILTQEDADLILKYFTEQMTQTGNGFGRGVRNFPNGWNSRFGQFGQNGQLPQGTPQGGFGRGGKGFQNGQFGQNSKGTQQGGCNGNCLPNSRNGQNSRNPQGTQPNGFGMGGYFGNTPSAPDAGTGATPNVSAPTVPNQNTFPAPGAVPGR